MAMRSSDLNALQGRKSVKSRLRTDSFITCRRAAVVLWSSAGSCGDRAAYWNVGRPDH